MLEGIAQIRKALVALVGGLLAAVNGLITGNVDAIDGWVEVSSSALLLVLTVYGVWRVPNNSAPDQARETLIGVLDSVSDVGDAAEKKSQDLQNE